MIEYSRRHHQIKPEKLGAILEEWDQTQNSGCTIEWDELAAETARQIQEQCPTYTVAKEPENRMKNRYMDILPCIILFFLIREQLTLLFCQRKLESTTLLF